MIKSILVVCIGNICRSPMAEGLLKAALHDVEVASAGIEALVGRSADFHAIDVMRAAGVDISGHRAQQINVLLCNHAELILVTENSQKKHIERSYPQSKGKVFLLSETDGEDIPDPYRKPKEDFLLSFDLISNGVQAWVKRINSLR